MIGGEHGQERCAECGRPMDHAAYVEVEWVRGEPRPVEPRVAYCSNHCATAEMRHELGLGGHEWDNGYCLVCEVEESSRG